MFKTHEDYTREEQLRIVAPCWVKGKFYTGKPGKENDAANTVTLGGEDKAILLVSKKAKVLK